MSELSTILNTAGAVSGLRIGGSSNYFEVRADGTVRLIDNATAWRDMIMDISGRRLHTAGGKVDYDNENNAIDFSSGGSIAIAADRVQGNQEINHQYLVGDNIVFKPHIHWFQEVTSHTPDVLDTTAYEITLRWRNARNGYGINLTIPDWTTTVLTSNGTNNIFGITNIGGKEYMCQITRFPDIITTCSVSDTIQCQMARTDALGGNMLIYFFDLHGQIDSYGSDEEIAKAA